MNRTLTAAWLLFVTLGAAAQQVAGADAQAYVDPRAYDVYSAALHLGSKTGPRFVQQLTIHADQCISPNGRYADKVQEASLELTRIAASQYLLVNSFTPAGMVQLLPETALQAARDKIVGPGRDPDYRQGLTTLSPVGFSQDATVAAVFIGRWCGNRCGSWRSEVFVNLNGLWIELKNQVFCETVS